MKKKTNFLIKSLSLLGLISLILIIFLLSFKLVVFDEKFYKIEFLKYDIYDEFSDENIDKINNNLLNYLKNEKKDIPIDSDFFNEKEKRHLIDVKNIIQSLLFLLSLLFSILLIFLLSTIIYFLFIEKNLKLLIKQLSFILIWSGLSVFIITLIIIFSSLISFDAFFTGFHLIAFDNDLWLLNPETDNLINMFPQEFFYDAALKIFLNSLIFAVIASLIGFLLSILIKRFKNKKNLI